MSLFIAIVIGIIAIWLVVKLAIGAVWLLLGLALAVGAYILAERVIGKGR